MWIRTSISGKRKKETFLQNVQTFLGANLACYEMGARGLFSV
jgi:hypothetical protein